MRYRWPVRIVSGLLALVMPVVNIVPPAYAQAVASLPQPGVMVGFSPSLVPPVLQGLRIDTGNPLRFEFILDRGSQAAEPQAEVSISDDLIRQTAARLVRYFCASLTVPEADLWVNLSPYERQRIIPDAFGLTGLGRDLLSQDYMLKQLTASVVYPEGDLGKRFWRRVYDRLYSTYGTTDIPLDMFNKVWIVPDTAELTENDAAGTVYIVRSRLKVMLDVDYSAWKASGSPAAGDAAGQAEAGVIHRQVMRDMIIPELEREVNSGEGFAPLRQAYQSLILAAWYKKRVTNALLSEVYIDRNRTAGIAIDDPGESQKIWERYVEAFRKGVYNYVREEQDDLSQELIPRKYFSGGMSLEKTGEALTYVSPDSAQLSRITGALKIKVDLVGQSMASLQSQVKGYFNGRVLGGILGAAVQAAVLASFPGEGMAWGNPFSTPPLYEKFELTSKDFYSLPASDPQRPVMVYQPVRSPVRALQLPAHLYKGIPRIYFLDSQRYAMTKGFFDPKHEAGYFNAVTGEVAVQDPESVSHEVFHAYWNRVLSPDQKKDFDYTYKMFRNDFSDIAAYAYTSESAEEALAELGHFWSVSPRVIIDAYRRHPKLRGFIEAVARAHSWIDPATGDAVIRLYKPLTQANLKEPYVDHPLGNSFALSKVINALEDLNPQPSPTPTQYTQDSIRLGVYDSGRVIHPVEAVKRYFVRYRLSFPASRDDIDALMQRLKDFMDRQADQKPGERRVNLLAPQAGDVIPIGAFLAEERGSSADKAQAVGGIDFSPGLVMMNVNRTGGDIQLRIDPAVMRAFRDMQGFEPVIVGVEGAGDLGAFLGLNGNVREW
jgi:hypothetical protein